jgi:hypothetical protein
VKLISGKGEKKVKLVDLLCPPVREVQVSDAEIPGEERGGYPGVNLIVCTCPKEGGRGAPDPGSGVSVSGENVSKREEHS